MDDYEKYFFDLNGYIVLENALTSDQVAACNAAIDHNRNRLTNAPSRAPYLQGLGLALGSKALAGARLRLDVSGMLTWSKPWSDPFRDLVACPKILPYVQQIIGLPCFLSSVDGFVMEPDTEGGVMHGGGVYSPHFSYRFQQGEMNGGLIGVLYTLTDANPGDGGYCCIPGSHKANYRTPAGPKGDQPDYRRSRDSIVGRLEKDIGVVEEITLKAGSAMIFTEALTHGTLPWKASHERRVLFYRYYPTLPGRIQEYLNEGVEDALEDFTQEQQTLIAPAHRRPM